MLLIHAISQLLLYNNIVLYNRIIYGHDHDVVFSNNYSTFSTTILHSYFNCRNRVKEYKCPVFAKTIMCKSTLILL